MHRALAGSADAAQVSCGLHDTCKTRRRAEIRSTQGTYGNDDTGRYRVCAMVRRPAPLRDVQLRSFGFPPIDASHQVTELGADLGRSKALPADFLDAGFESL